MSSGYIAEGSYKKPKFTPGLTFVVMDTRKRYTGFYIEDSRGRFYSGKAPGDKSVQLEKVELEIPGGLKAGLKKAAVTLAAGLAAKVISNFERQKGKTKRYFVQNKTTQKISETDKATYEQAKTDLPNSNFAEVDWELLGPAEDQMFGGYKYTGAATKNKAAIQALESQIKGISNFITDYKYLVEEPVVIQPEDLTTQTFVETDPQVELEEGRKARFDKRNDILFPSASIWATEAEAPIGIIQEGLVIYLDASNPYSYPGPPIGNTTYNNTNVWLNVLTGHGGGSLVSSYVFNNANGGSLSNASMNWDNTGYSANGTQPRPSVTSFTISYTIKITSLPTTGTYYLDVNDSIDVNGYTTQINTSTNSFEITFNLVSPPTHRTIPFYFNRSEILNNIINVAWTFDGTTVHSYLNGVLQNSNNIPFIPTDAGYYQYTPLDFTGNTYDIIKYDKALTSAEVLQNYKAIKLKCLI